MADEKKGGGQRRRVILDLALPVYDDLEELAATDDLALSQVLLRAARREIDGHKKGIGRCARCGRVCECSTE